ncbi:hypothetical protein HZS_1170 [Henneguya salminicola]|nr:hypothetical protein HZS_1170 [Henneguya salminicola]
MRTKFFVSYLSFNSIKFKLFSPSTTIQEDIKGVNIKIEKNKIKHNQIDVYKNIDVSCDKYSKLLKDYTDESTSNSQTYSIFVIPSFLSNDLKKTAIKESQNKVSKDRRLKYQTHARLVGFMPPYPCLGKDCASRSTLLASLLKNNTNTCDSLDV